MTDSNKGLRILIIEDNSHDQYLITELLNASVIKIQLLTAAGTLGKAIELLQKEIFDIIFLDLFLPDSYGISSFTAVKQVAGKIPVIILSGLTDMNIAVEAISLGAQDFHIKGELDEKTLTKTILYSIERKSKLENLREDNGRYITISKAELGLMQSGEITRQIISAALDAIICIDMYGKIAVWNPRAEKIFGWKQNEILGKTIKETIIPSGFHGMYEKGMNHYLATSAGPILNKIIEITAVNREGRHFPVELSIVPLTEGGNQFFCAFIRDNTEMKKAETELKHSNERFELITRTTNDAVWEWDFETGKMWGNETHQELYGLTIDDPVPEEKQWHQRLHPDDRNSIIQKYTDALASDSNIFLTEYRFNSEKAGYIDIYDRCYIVRNEEGKAIRILGSMIDVSERKKIEREIIESEARYRAFFENSLDGILLTTPDGKIIAANPSACRLFGMTEDEIYRAGRSGLVDMTDPNLPILLEQRQSTGKARGELKLIYKDGSKFYAEISTSVFKDSIGEERTFMIIHDITERKKAEQELEESYKAIRKLTEHLQNIREEERAHMAREIHDELGQQLTVLKMDISWINKKIEIKDETVIERMNELLVMLDETVNSVRRISSELRPSLLDDLGLVAAMEWQLTEFEKRFGIKTQFKPDDAEIVMSESIKTGLFRIFQESLTNVARHSKAKKVNVSLALGKSAIVLTVSDNGVGFDKQNPIGKKTLGILGMQERTSMMGGSYEISGKPGKGTRIVATIPLEGSIKI